MKLCQKITDTGLVDVSKLTQLNSLNLEGCTKVTLTLPKKASL